MSFSGPGDAALLLVDKPKGLSSHEVAARLRRLTGLKKVGHSGTLDPLATGLMLMLLGGATRLESLVVGLGKSYEAELELGLTTDTNDISGRILARHSGPWPNREVLASALAELEGERWQTPPAYSAVKVGGRRAYKAARAGLQVQVPPRLVTARSLALLSYEPPCALIRAQVSSGYYIRSLARDLGLKLGLGGATLKALRRLSVGPFAVAEAFSLEDLAASEPDGRPVWLGARLKPAEALSWLPRLPLAEARARRFALGQSLPLTAAELREARTAPNAVERKRRPHEPEQVCLVLTESGELLGLGETKEFLSSLGGSEPQGPFLRPLRVLKQTALNDGRP